VKTESVERFNRTAEGYLRWWAPVLAPASTMLLDRLEVVDRGLTGGRTLDVVDVGCGTGNLLFEAARRWPAARLVGLDASTGMLDVARREAAALPDSTRVRVGYVEADAAAIRFADDSFDLVMSAFMLQQVPDRAAVLSELFRISSPGGLVGIAGWLTETVPFRPDLALEAALAEAGIVRPTPRDARSGHFRSVRQAAEELRRAGFANVAARADQLEHRWPAEDYITYRTTTRDLDLFEVAPAEAREKAINSVRRRLGSMAQEDLVFRPPIVTIVARKG
jgi:ubiquinone/menaquinone biosynthesis C-methylase UbiE